MDCRRPQLTRSVVFQDAGFNGPAWKCSLAVGDKLTSQRFEISLPKIDYCVETRMFSLRICVKTPKLDYVLSHPYDTQCFCYEMPSALPRKRVNKGRRSVHANKDEFALNIRRVNIPPSPVHVPSPVHA